MNEAFLPIAPYTIRSNVAQSFDLYFQTDEEKFALYCAGGQKTAESTHVEVPGHAIDTLFIPKKSWIPYHLYVEDNLDGILDTPGLNALQKATVAYRSMVFTAELLFRAPRAEFIHRYKRTIQSTMKHVLRNNGMLHHLVGMTPFNFSIANHSINVGIYGLGLMREFSDGAPVPNAENVVTGFFLHDIGKCRVPAEILSRKGPLSRVEARTFRSHVEEGVKILAEAGALNRDAELIISQHHERQDGLGYPLGLRGDSINANAQICAIADVFDDLMASRPNQAGHSLFESMKIMKTEMFAGLDPACFQKFVRLFSGRQSGETPENTRE